MNLPQTTMDALVAQYRGEVSAVEAYDRALEKFAGQPEELTLLRMQAEHRNAVRQLNDLIRRYEGIPPESSGAWGAFATAIEKLASLINDEVPLQVLHRGEVVGCEGYSKLLGDRSLPDEAKTYVSELLNRCRTHQERLVDMIHRLPEAPTRPMLG